MDDETFSAPSDRVTLRRRSHRGSYDPAIVREILDAGVVAHVGVHTDDGPIVLPMAYGRTDDTLYLHGSAANSMLRAARRTEICVTVTLIDGLVFARSPFHNSMNYRSVVIRGVARPVDDIGEHVDALRRISNHVVTSWEHGREPTAAEIRKTMVVALPLEEASAKVRRGDPVDEPGDLDGPHWAGTVALEQAWGPPVDAEDLRPGIETPSPIVAAFGGGNGG
jgi:uncharacterized protein